MIVQESISSQDLRITPRRNNIQSVEVYDEQTREEISITSISVVVDEYTTIVSGIFPFKENCSYVLNFIDTDGKIVNFVRAFCTSQNPQENKILNGAFVSNVTDNTFVII